MGCNLKAFLGASLLLAAAGPLFAQAPLPEPGQATQARVKLLKSSGKLCTVEGATYKAGLISEAMSLSAAQKAGDGFAQSFPSSCFLAFGGGWTRLFDQGGLSKPSSSVSMNADGDAVAKLKASSESLKLEAELTFHPDSIDCKYKLEALKEIPKIQRIDLELNPPWEAAAGAELIGEASDGSLKTVAVPKEETKDKQYSGILGGAFKSIEVKGLYGAPEAGFKVEGPLQAALEQTGKSFRWHFGAPLEFGKGLKAGESVEFKLTLRFKAIAKESLAKDSAEIAVDAAKAGSKISPYVFGGQLGGMGFGVKTWWAKNPWQFNPKYDLEFRKFVEDSGVSFFRIYLHHLYPMADKEKDDPIWPSEEAPCDYTRADSIMDALTEMGVEVMPCVGLYCPPWLSTQRKSPKHSGLWMIMRAPPKDNAKWAKMIAGLVTHFNVEKKYGVKLWQVGNEPNDPVRYWIGGTLPEFADYFKTASKAMKEADPSIKISGPDLSKLYDKAWPENTLEWKDEFVRLCKDDFDDFSFNCYGETDFSKFLQDARETLAKYGVPQKSVYVAEYNLTAGDYDNISEFNFDGALFVAKALRSLISNKADRASFYTFNGDALGFIGKDGERSYLYPSYHAFRMHAKLGAFKNASLLDSSSSSPGTQALACRHEDGKGYSLIVSSDSPLVGKRAFKFALNGASGQYLAKRYVMEEGLDGIKELPEIKVDAAKGLELEAAGKSIVMLVLRKD